jgi:phospho-N-acetylmuramoyl-pentapeptide-transferase
MLGEILISGMAAMLICIFLGPKFIEYLRLREFGQQIREEGPQEHHEKAGTPTMGGLLIFTAISVPYLVLSDRDTQSLAVFGVALGCAAIGFVDDYLKITRRRSLGLSARYKLLLQLGLAVGLWYVARHSVGLDSSLELRISHASLNIPDGLYPLVIFLVIAGSSNAVNLTDGLDGLGRAAARSSCSPTRRSPSSPPASTASRCSRRAWWGAVSASSGSTPFRRRSSWATLARSA